MVIYWSDSVKNRGFANVSSLMGSGIYILRLKGVVVYVGQSKTMLPRLYTHYYARRNRGKAYMKLKRMSFDEIWIMPCHKDDLNRIERQFIQEFVPRYNICHTFVPLDIKALVSSLIVRDPNTHPSIGRIERRI